ncbi:MAG: hypothetical protein WCY38_06380 [Endomicrobiia bacterium]
MEKPKIKVMGIEMDDISESIAEDINQRYEKIGKRFPFQDPEKLRMMAIREFIYEIVKMEATISYLRAEVNTFREKEIERLEIKRRLAEDED